LGKAYHLAKRFDDAIKAYVKYKEVAGTKVEEKVNRQIEMCNNGKQFMKYPVKCKRLKMWVRKLIPSFPITILSLPRMKAH